VKAVFFVWKLAKMYLQQILIKKTISRGASGEEGGEEMRREGWLRVW